MVDRDNSGKIELGELRLLLENIGIKLSHEEVSSIMRFFDVDNDNKLSYKEFVKRMRRYGLRGRAVEYNILRNLV